MISESPACSRKAQLDVLPVRRPHIGYPEAIFAGVPAKTFEGASLSALIA
jgi:hypothetical protein